MSVELGLDVLIRCFVIGGGFLTCFLYRESPKLTQFEVMSGLGISDRFPHQKIHGENKIECFFRGENLFEENTLFCPEKTRLLTGFFRAN